MERKHFPVIIEQDRDGVYIVTCPIFQGCHSYGQSVDEAVHNITEAIHVCWEEKNTHQDVMMQFVGIRDVELAL